MKRKTMLSHGAVTTYDREGNVLSHWEGEQDIYVPLQRDPEVFEAFKAAIYAGENIIEIALRFDTDHCTVLHWKKRLVDTYRGY